MLKFLGNLINGARKVKMTIEQMIVNELVLEHGMSKWAIAKRLECRWQTVHNWHKGIYHADDIHMGKLKGLLIIARTKDGNYLFPDQATLQKV